MLSFIELVVYDIFPNNTECTIMQRQKTLIGKRFKDIAIRDNNFGSPKSNKLHLIDFFHCKEKY